MRIQQLACVAVVLALGAACGRADDKPELTYKQDGNDLVVSTKVRLNNSPHAVVAWVEGNDKAITLRYVAVQNTDALVRSQKWETVEWRLPGKKEGDVRVKGVEPLVVTLKSSDLKPFAEQLKKVAEAGEKKGG